MDLTSPEGDKSLEKKYQRTKEDLEDLEVYIRDFAAFLPLPVCTLNPLGLIININQATEDLTGYDSFELVGESITTIFTEKEEVEGIGEEIRETDPIHNKGLTLITKDGKEIPVNVSVSARRDARENYIGYFLALSDITETRALQETLEQKVEERTQELKNAYEELKGLNRLKTEFMLITTHELGSPLTSIITLAQLMQDKHTVLDKETQLKNLDIILHNSQKLHRLVKNILEFSRIETGKLTFNMTEVNMEDIVESVCVDLGSLAFKKNITLSRHYSEGLPNVKADSERLESVVSNLVCNAIKFTPKGGKITVNVCVENQTVKVSVCDTGIGIPADKQGRLFEKFYQVDSGPYRQYGGVGMGLAIAKKIIQSHGGRIWIESNLGQGSTFYFTLPFKK